MFGGDAIFIGGTPSIGHGGDLSIERQSAFSVKRLFGAAFFIPLWRRRGWVGRPWLSPAHKNRQEGCSCLSVARGSLGETGFLFQSLNAGAQLVELGVSDFEIVEVGADRVEGVCQRRKSRVHLVL